MRFNQLLVLFTSLLLAGSCQPDRASKKVKEKAPPTYRIQLQNLNRSGEYYQIGDSIRIRIEWLKEEMSNSGFQISYDKVPVGKIDSPDGSLIYVLPPRAGQRQFKAEHESGTKYQGITVLSDITPPEWEWELINTFPHDPEAYTQGLYYDGEIIYEGTGLKKRSSLRKVELETGKLIQSTNLPPEIFGEGITLFDGKIYQLSWRAQRGFIWNADDLSLLSEFSYPGEGWGITHNDSLIFRSNGSQVIEVLDRTSLNPLYQIQVFNHRGPVIEINELEYINGLIFANIYGTNEIGIIEPESGRVVGYLELGELEKSLPRSPGQRRDVMNGIAWNAESGNIYVTGKLWPQLFELKLQAP
jgi:glutamine cyclotransferase